MPAFGSAFVVYGTTVAYMQRMQQNRSALFIKTAQNCILYSKTNYIKIECYGRRRFI